MSTWAHRSGFSFSLALALTVGAPLGAQEPGALVGQIRSVGTGTPISGAMVLLDMGPKTTTDGEGKFRLSELPGGAYRIAAVAPGCHVALGTVDAVAGRELTFDMDVPLPEDADRLLAAWNPAERSSGNALRSMSGDEMQERKLRSAADAVRVLAPDLAAAGGQGGPLVIVNGARVAESPVNALASMSASDVTRVSVAEGVSDGWHYGVWGANGLIVVVTRKAEGEYAPDTPPADCGFVFPP